MRDEWGFEGFVVSDCGAISNIMTRHHYTNNSDQTCAAGILGGCDADCPGGEPPVTYPKGIVNAVDAGSPEAALDRSLVRMWTAAFDLGLIDDPTEGPFASLGMEDIDTPATRELNVDAAIQSMVLLKNDPPSSGGGPVLPIKSGQTVAVLGPHFNSTQALLSDYAPGRWPGVQSPLMAAQKLLGDRLVGGAQGCDLEGMSTDGIAAAVALAKQADVAVVFVGLTPQNDPTNAGYPPVVGKGDAFECEGHDRNQITLQGQQENLIKQVMQVNPQTVVVLIHGGALALEWTKANVPAILDAHYPGQLGGTAVFRTLLNHNGAAPAGRLTTTFYASDFVERNMTRMDLKNITYKVGLPVQPLSSASVVCSLDLKLSAIDANVPIGARASANC